MGASVRGQPGLGRRLAITFILPVLYLLGQRIVAPGIDAAAIERLGGLGQLNMLALGIMPAISAYIWVEFSAAAIPKWAKLRHVPNGRRKLERAATIMMVALAIFQTYGITMYVRGLEDRKSDLVLGGGGVWLFGLTIVTGFCLTALAARYITRQGIANGFVLLLMADEVTECLVYLWRAAGAPGSSDPWMKYAMSPSLRAGLMRSDPVVPTVGLIVILASTVVALVASVLALARWTPNPTSRIPLPASSLYPITVGPYLLAFPGMLGGFHLPGSREVAQWLVQPNARLAVLFLIALTGGYLLTVLLSHPEKVVAATGRILDKADGVRLEDARADLRQAMLPTALMLVALVLAEAAIERVSVVGPRLVVVVPMLTAVVIDAVRAIANHREQRDLVCIWEERRPYVVPAIRSALEAVGINVRPQQESQAALVRPFGAYAPIQIVTTSADAARATKELHRRLSAEPAPTTIEAPEKTEPTPAPPERSTPRDPRTPVFALLVGAAAGLLLLSRTLPTEAERAMRPRRQVSLAIEMVDDTAQPFAAIQGALPDGSAIQKELLGRGQESAFALAVGAPGEPWEKVRDRLATWTSTLPLPPGDRFAFGEVRLEDESPRKRARTYVLRSPAIVTGDDIESVIPISQGPNDTYISISLKQDASERFRVATGANVKGRMAIVLGGKVESAPRIMSEIAGGHLSITVSSLEDPVGEAERLARELNGR